MSLVLFVATVERHPQGDLTRAVPFVLAGLLLWAVVLGIVFGSRWGVVVALVGGAIFFLAAGLYVIFVPQIDFAECEQLFLELSNKACRGHSDLGWAVLFLVSAVCCGTLGVIASRSREQTVHSHRSA